MKQWSYNDSNSVYIYEKAKLQMEYILPAYTVSIIL